MNRECRSFLNATISDQQRCRFFFSGASQCGIPLALHDDCIEIRTEQGRALVLLSHLAAVIEEDDG